MLIFRLMRRRLRRTSSCRAQTASGLSTLKLKAKLREHSEHPHLIDQVWRIQHIHAVRIIRIALDKKMLLEIADILDQPVVLVHPILRDQLAHDDAGRNDGLSRTKARAV